MPKFKVGDRVRVTNISPRREWKHPFIGLEGTVLNIFKCAKPNTHCYHVSGFDYLFHDDELELVHSAKFHVGDKVRIIADTSIGQEKSKHIGQCFTITNYIDSKNSVFNKDTYEFDETIYSWFDNELELVKENNMFTKKDLKEFDIVKLRSGDVFMVLRNNRSRDGLAIFNKAHWGCHQYMHNYNDDLTYKGRSDDDIVAVKKFDGDGIYTLLNDFFTEGRTRYDWDWERKEVEEMTLEEVCKALGKEIKIVKEN